jgi:two-component system, cell cycle sensor histidine kinase and response regulator CckA
VLGISGTLIDITDRKAADAERKALEHKLLETQKLESLDVLAGGIAHDFNNLLMTILGNAELALLDLPALAAARTSVARIELAARRASELTGQMLAYAGKGRMVIGRFDLNTLVEEITALLDVSISKATTLRYMLAPQLPLIAGDATQIRQVIMNLVLNAAEAVGAATSTIVVVTGMRHADQLYLASTWLAPELPEGEYVFLEVIDDGSGMSAETLAKIFDPFFTTPHLDGEQTMRAIQAIRPDALVVIMSGYNQQSLTERFAGLGPAGFLQKPFQPTVLQKTIKQVLAPVK